MSALAAEAVARATGMAALLGRIAADQDQRAFAELFGHFAPRIKAYLLRLGAGEAVAEDLAQETLLAVWRKAAQFDPARAEPATWVFAIARNLRIDWLRRERRPQAATESDAAALAALPDTAPLPDQQVAEGRRDARLREALATLPAEQAEVVRQSFFADHAHGDIARDLGIPLGTVKSRLRLALRRVRVALGEEQA